MQKSIAKFLNALVATMNKIINQDLPPIKAKNVMLAVIFIT